MGTEERWAGEAHDVGDGRTGIAAGTAAGTRQGSWYLRTDAGGRQRVAVVRLLPSELAGQVAPAGQLTCTA